MNHLLSTELSYFNMHMLTQGQSNKTHMIGHRVDKYNIRYQVLVWAS